MLITPVFQCPSLRRRFLPNTYTDSEFGGLQCVFALFRFLLLYHDPELSQWLDQFDLGPELYASSWFITLYANRTKSVITLISSLTTILVFRTMVYLTIELYCRMYYYISGICCC
jgi:hypothetical protein